MSEGKFAGENLKEVKSLCMSCKLRSKKVHGVCLAFPEGIPQAFILGEKDHTESVAGDGGLVYVKDVSSVK